MADGLNDARALRIVEVMNDFQTTQHRLSQLQAAPPAGQQQEIGYGILRQCRAEAQALLSTPFAAGADANNAEHARQQLRSVLLDASAKRFRVHRTYLRAVAAMRWVQRRRQILQGQNPQPMHMAALRQADNDLRNEITAITDNRVFNELQAKDQAAGHWTAEMPDLNRLLNYIRTH